MNERMNELVVTQKDKVAIKLLSENELHVALHFLKKICCSIIIIITIVIIIYKR